MNQRSRATARDGDVIRRPETKSFILTSEFWVGAAAAAAVFLAGYTLDDIAKTTAWRYGVWIAIAYIISRGSRRPVANAIISPNQSRIEAAMGFGVTVTVTTQPSATMPNVVNVRSRLRRAIRLVSPPRHTARMTAPERN